MPKVTISVAHKTTRSCKPVASSISPISAIIPLWIALVLKQEPLPSSTIPPHKHTHLPAPPSFLLSSQYSLPPPPLSPLWFLCAEEMEGLLKLSVLLFLLLLSHKLSLSSSRRFDVDMSVMYIFFCGCRTLWMFYRWHESYFLNVSSLSFSSRLSLSRPNLCLKLSYPNSHVPLLLQTEPPSLSLSIHPGCPRILSCINLSSFSQTSHIGLLPSLPWFFLPSLFSSSLLSSWIFQMQWPNPHFCWTDINHLVADISQRGNAGSPAWVWLVNKQP